MPRVKNEICFIFLPDAIGRLYLEAIKKSNQSAWGGRGGGETHDTHRGEAQACQTRAHPTPELPLFIYLAFNVYLDLTPSLPPAFKWLKQSPKSTARGFGGRRGVRGWTGPGAGRSIPPALHRSGAERSGCAHPDPCAHPWPSLWMSHLVPHRVPLAPSSFAGREGGSGVTVNQYFPFILAEADESGRKAGPTALPPPISPQTHPWVCYQREKFSPPQRRCETWQFCSLRGELQPLQNANKQTNAN